MEGAVGEGGSRSHPLERRTPGPRADGAVGREARIEEAQDETSVSETIIPEGGHECYYFLTLWTWGLTFAPSCPGDSFLTGWELSLFPPS